MHGMEQAKSCQVPVDISVSDTGGTEKLPQYKFYKNICLSGLNSDVQASPLRGHWGCVSLEGAGVSLLRGSWTFVF